MEWTKASTTLISKRYSDYEIVSIVKFQLIWAMNEEMPDYNTALRYMTKKQYETAMTYLDSIAARVGDDVSRAIKNRQAEKIRYNKNNTLKKNLAPECQQNVSSLDYKIRKDIDKNKNKEKIDKKEIKQNVKSDNVDVVSIVSQKEQKRKELSDILLNVNENIKKPLEKWLEYKKQRKQNYTSIGLKECASKLEKISMGCEDMAMQIVNESISNGWSGLFPLKNKPKELTKNERNWEIMKETFGFGGKNDNL